MGIANSILGNANKLISALNPIRLFEAGAWTKLETAYHRHMAAAADPFDTIQKLGKVAYGIGRNNYTSAIKNIKGTDTNIARGMADYMSGYKLGLSKSDIAPGRLRFNSIVRKSAVAGLGIYSASSLMMGENKLTKTTDALLSAGTHLTMGALAHKINPVLGYGYGALSMVNILRSGDQIGPY